MRAAAKIQTPDAYLASLPDYRRVAITTLHNAIRNAAPELEPHIQAGMLGYGRYHYKNASGREGDWFIVGLASQKNYISLTFAPVIRMGTWPHKTKVGWAKSLLGEVVSGSRNSRTWICLPHWI